jgi:hypothetical protein
VQPTSTIEEFFYIICKTFCKNIQRFENFALLTSIRVGRRGVRIATDGGMEWRINRCAYRVAHDN